MFGYNKCIPKSCFSLKKYSKTIFFNPNYCYSLLYNNKYSNTKAARDQRKVNANIFVKRTFSQWLNNGMVLISRYNYNSNLCFIFLEP